MKTVSALLVFGALVAGSARGAELNTDLDLDLDLEINFPLVPRATLTNLMTFTGALGGAVADPITNSGDPTRPFEVAGDTFTDLTDAWTRSCNNQHNACALIANESKSSGFTTGQCDTQQTTCIAAQADATQTTFQVLTSQNAEFYFICDS